MSQFQLVGRRCTARQQPGVVPLAGCGPDCNQVGGLFVQQSPACHRLTKSVTVPASSPAELPSALWWAPRVLPVWSAARLPTLRWEVVVGWSCQTTHYTDDDEQGHQHDGDEEATSASTSASVGSCGHDSQSLP
jgi:hypothetical protein